MHEGHRQRMYEKIIGGDSLYDHELLEILLFNAFPRKNTNPLAHALLDAFGSLAGVFSADFKQLITVDGVGKNVALYIKCVGECIGRIKQNNTPAVVLKTYDDFKRFTVIRLRGKTEEVVEFYCLEKSGKIKRIFTYSCEDRNRVELDTDSINHILALAEPYALLIAHNHLSGSSEPSADDDVFTAKIQLICSSNNVVLYDHCIYATDENVYSYFASGKIDKIRKNFSLGAIVERQMKLSEEEDKK